MPYHDGELNSETESSTNKTSSQDSVSRRRILATISSGSLAGLAGCSEGTDSDSTPQTGGEPGSPGSSTTETGATGTADGGIADQVYNGFYTLNPPNDLYFGPFGPTAGGMGLYHWAMMFSGIAQYDPLNPEQAMSAIYADHPRHTDPIEDGTATINIREDLTWHDGESYTARDFVTERLLQLYLLRSTGGEDALPYSDVRLVDDYTLEVDMRDPAVPHDPWWSTMYGPNLHHSCCTIGTGPVWIQHSKWSSWLERYQDAAGQAEMKSITQEIQNARRPFEETIGYGPFKIREISGQTVVYEPHEEWQGLIAINWPNTEQYARVGRDVHETFIENDMTAELTFYAESSAQAQAAIAGDLDYVRINSVDQGQTLANDHGWSKPTRGGQIYASGTTVGYHVNFNTEPLHLRQVRQALLHLMPQKQLARIGFQNTQETSQQSPAPIPAPVGIPWANVQTWLNTDNVANNWSGYDVESSNTETATTLLQDAGLSKQGGVWRTESGEPFTLDMKQRNDTPVAVSRAFKGILDNFGIQTEFTAIEATTVRTTLASGNFDLFYDFDEGGGAAWPGENFKGGLVFTGQNYPWGSSQGRQVGHPMEWEVPSIIGEQNSDSEIVNVVPLIKDLNTADKNHESLTRRLAWIFNQTVPSLIYANGKYAPADDERRLVGQMYNSNDWYIPTREENHGIVIRGGAYPQSFYQFGAFQPRHE